jgi:hypothetical protein
MLIARERIASLGFELPDPGQASIHSWLIRGMKRGHTRLRSLGFELESLSECRQQADYELDCERIEPDEAVEWVNAAERWIAAFSGLSESVHRTFRA